jgi:serine/threonine-protein kinase RsbW
VARSRASTGVATSNSTPKIFHMRKTEQPVVETVHWFYDVDLAKFCPFPLECRLTCAQSLLGAMKRQKIEFSSHTGNLALMRKWVQNFLDTCPLSDKERTLMVLGVDEACTNIIRHAYQLRDDQLIALSLEGLRKCVRMRLRDYGQQVATNQMRGRSHDVVKPGGLGLYLMRNAFDRVDYILKRRGTELVLTKDLD